MTIRFATFLVVMIGSLACVAYGLLFHTQTVYKMPNPEEDPVILDEEHVQELGEIRLTEWISSERITTLADHLAAVGNDREVADPSDLHRLIDLERVAECFS